jgi:hypothetical protein
MCCHGSASEDRDWFLDLGEFAGDEGEMANTVYICKLCLVAVLAEKGIVEQGPLLERISGLEDKLFEAKTKADGLEQGFVGCLRARLIAPDDPGVRDLGRFLEDPPEDLVSSGDGAPGLAAEGGEPAEPGDGSAVGGFRPSLAIDGGARG